ncbi:hypothetical protein E4U41_004526 [Claviceps citrina]|nr:hypothetical protein E4U41_004526 [Claviceps citrina]
MHLLMHLSIQQGDPMVIRVGGESGDRVVFDPKLRDRLVHHCQHGDKGPKQCFGRGWFSAYNSYLTTILFSHAFNLATWNSSGFETLDATVKLAACDALWNQTDSLELGHEPDLYGVGGDGEGARERRRPASYSVEDYLSEWRNRTARFDELLMQSCPGKLHTSKFMFPSVSSPGSRFRARDLDRLLTEQDRRRIGLVSVHGSMGEAGQPGVTLHGTLMNHSKVVESVRGHVEYARSLGSVRAPYVIGQLVSLTGGGAENLTDTLGAALWAMDFALCAAASGVIKRVYFHQKLHDHAAAWWPTRPIKVRASYYGLLAAGGFLANATRLRVAEFDVGGDGVTASGYKGYFDGKELTRVALLNLKPFDHKPKRDRPWRRFVVDVGAPETRWIMKRLRGPGSDARSHLTWNDFYYEYESLGQWGSALEVTGGKDDVPIWADTDGRLTVDVADSEAVVIFKRPILELGPNINF